MRWVDLAEQDLTNYNGLKVSLENIQERIKTLEIKAQSIRGNTLEHEKVRGGGKSYEDFLIDNITERERLKLLYAANQKLVALIENGLSCLDDNERITLEYIFIDRKKKGIQKLCEDLHIERTTAYKYRQHALHSFVVAMYGLPEY